MKGAISLAGMLAVGAVMGLLANWLNDRRRSTRRVDVALGIAGAAGGGFMFWNFSDSLYGFNLYGLLVAATGALAVLLTYHALFVYPGDYEGD